MGGIWPLLLRSNFTICCSTTKSLLTLLYAYCSEASRSQGQRRSFKICSGQWCQMGACELSSLYTRSILHESRIFSSSSLERCSPPATVQMRSSTWISHMTIFECSEKFSTALSALATRSLRNHGSSWNVFRAWLLISVPRHSAEQCHHVANTLRA